MGESAFAHVWSPARAVEINEVSARLSVEYEDSATAKNSLPKGRDVIGEQTRLGFSEPQVNKEELNLLINASILSRCKKLRS